MKFLRRLSLLPTVLLLAHWFFIRKLRGTASLPLAKFTRKEGALPEREAGPEFADSAVSDIIWACYTVTHRLPWLNTCIVRSLTATALLRAFGFPAELHIGVRKGPDPDVLDAHAWVTGSGGQVICDEVSDLETYQEVKR